MEIKEYFESLINRVIEKNQHLVTIQNVFCCDEYNCFSVIETERIRLTFWEETSMCELVRKKTDHSVFCRNTKGEIYRFSGEIAYLKKELFRLGGQSVSDVLTEYEYD